MISEIRQMVESGESPHTNTKISIHVYFNTFIIIYHKLDLVRMLTNLVLSQCSCRSMKKDIHDDER
jgi:hypothetical protein